MTLPNGDPPAADFNHGNRSIGGALWPKGRLPAGEPRRAGDASLSFVMSAGNHLAS